MTDLQGMVALGGHQFRLTMGHLRQVQVAKKLDGLAALWECVFTNQDMDTISRLFSAAGGMTLDEFDNLTYSIPDMLEALAEIMGPLFFGSEWKVGDEPEKQEDSAEADRPTIAEVASGG